MTFGHAIFLFFAALIAGVQNSVAGGGTFFSFPALLFAGVPPIPANATSTVALWPGTMASAAAYRKRLPHSARILVPLVLASLAGGFIGAGLLLKTPPATFMRLIPFLFLGATLLFAFGKRLFKISQPPKDAKASWLAVGGVALLQIPISIYGGFFGGGIGILMLATLNFLPLPDIHAMNGVKTLLASATNAAAIATFVVAGIVVWPEAIVMLVGAAAGGYAGAHYAQKVDAARVRSFIVVVGFAMSFYFLWKYR
ncbi:MAG TPA: sulfite exporter TauE/SafE family protein [Terriglobia bacterium]|nr:sulfite exporter TauE/SafE family protein [Terriglobia bacterium]